MNKLMEDSFIESIISLDGDRTNEDNMIYRQFNGMEAVAQFDEQNTIEGGDNE